MVNTYHWRSDRSHYNIIITRFSTMVEIAIGNTYTCIILTYIMYTYHRYNNKPSLKIYYTQC